MKIQTKGQIILNDDHCSPAISAKKVASFDLPLFTQTDKNSFRSLKTEQISVKSMSRAKGEP